MKMNLIVAYDESRGMGRDNTLPWHLSADLKRFKALTTSVSQSQQSNAVVMGRKTWESLPTSVRPLPHRHNIMLSTQNLDVSHDSLDVVESWDDLIERWPTIKIQHQLDQIFVIGGSRVFEEALHRRLVETIFITELKGSFACDVFFPPLPDHFRCVDQSEWMLEANISYRYLQFVSFVN